MSSTKKTANAVGGKTARACDSCMRKRARWYCTADDAFLCQACDASVHSANSLAKRHERVRIKTASGKLTEENPLSVENSPPAWLQGFRRKPRTPRHGKHAAKKEEEDTMLNISLPLVPELGSDEVSFDENEEHLLYRVPIFDPFLAEIYASNTPNEAMNNENEMPVSTPTGGESKIAIQDYGHDGTVDFESLPGLLPSDMDLADFAADVETLLGRGLDGDSFGMEGLGLLDTKEENYYDQNGKIKVEDEEEEAKNMVGYQFGSSDLDMSRETLDLNFDCDSPTTGEEEEEKANMTMNYGCKMEEKISLRLDYDAVIAAWSSQGSPWMAGDRPQLNPDDCWPDALGTYIPEGHQMYGDTGSMGGHATACSDGGREARVSRYREKRRTRLFSKKIRYEVRKLNAEKRPRMKGRFVKRASFAAGGAVGGGGPSSFAF